MSDLEFETRLDRMFAEPPHFQDAELFARLLEQRMERGWSLRRLLIGGAGIVAGIVGVGQMMGAGLFLKAAGSEATAQASAVGKAFTEVMSALGVMALGFAITRATQEF